MKKVAVVGTRRGIPRERVEKDLDRLAAKWGRFHVVTGGASGVDAHAESWARGHSFPVTVYTANWQLGTRAGPLRNGEIVADCECMVAFWDGASPGTADALLQAEKAGKPRYIRIVGLEG